MRIAFTVRTLVVSDMVRIMGKKIYLYELFLTRTFESSFVLLSFFFAASQRRHTPSKRRHTPNLCAHNPRNSITFSASMLELRLRRNGLKREIRKSGSGREKEMEKRRMKGGRADERAGIHSQVGEKHTCPNPLLLAAVFLSTWKSDVATNPKSLSLSLPPSLSSPDLHPLLLALFSSCCNSRIAAAFSDRHRST